MNWAQILCPACDLATDGAAYCSQRCRLEGYESASPVHTSRTSSSSSSYGSGSTSVTSLSSSAGQKSPQTVCRQRLDVLYEQPIVRPPPHPRKDAQPCSRYTTYQCARKEKEATISEEALRELRAYSWSFNSHNNRGWH
ncbi:hypothetical protein GQ53DRAFT_129891 [Thozetella sp. PMI_491]|nr:hypothetical protein GQ53DRAFT_129891 [Thozetella sp. PMI_491]